MKIVVNKCFGGFGLSNKAVLRYAKLSGFKLYPFTEKRKDDGRIIFGEFEPYIGQESFCVHYSKSPLKNGKYKKEDYFSYRDINRTDKNLIKVIQDMGKESNGPHADLNIIEIPDGIEYEIDDYDGIETVHEKHRSW